MVQWWSEMEPVGISGEALVFDEDAFDQTSFTNESWFYGAIVVGVRRVVVRLRSLSTQIVTLASRIWN